MKRQIEFTQPLRHDGGCDPPARPCELARLGGSGGWKRPVVVRVRRGDVSGCSTLAKPVSSATSTAAWAAASLPRQSAPLRHAELTVFRPNRGVFWEQKKVTSSPRYLRCKPNKASR